MGGEYTPGLVAIYWIASIKETVVLAQQHGKNGKPLCPWVHQLKPCRTTKKWAKERGQFQLVSKVEKMAFFK